MLCALLLLVQTGCRKAGEPQKIVLRLASWGVANDDSEFTRAQLAIYKEFERQHPGVEIRPEGIPGAGEYVPKMLLNFVADSAADIMVLDASSAAAFIDNGFVRDLAPLSAGDDRFRWADYYPNVVEIGSRGEKRFWVPIDFTPIVLYYNKRLFDSSGVPYPPDHWNFDDFVATAKKLTKGNQYGFKFANWMPGWVPWIWNMGGDVLSPDGTRATGFCDSNGNARAVEFLYRLTNRDKVAPNLSAAAAMGVDLFTNGSAAMEVSGHWAMVGYSAAPKDANGKPLLDLKDVGVTFLPTELSESQTVIYAAGYAITRNCKDPKLAWEFIRFMTSVENQRRLNKTGIAVSGRMDVSRENANNEREKKFLQIIPTARVPWGSRVERYEFVETSGQKMLDSVMLNDKDPRLALKQMADEIDREFAK